jgi:hypothetical protein
MARGASTIKLTTAAADLQVGRVPDSENESVWNSGLDEMTRIEPSSLYYKSFMIVIYDCNDSSQYYNTLITIVSYAPNLTLVLASVVNYDCK